MISSRGKTNFGRPSVNSLALRELVRMLAFDNTSLRSTWSCQSIVSTPERLLVFIPSRIRERESLFTTELREIISVNTFNLFICRPYDAKNPFLASVKVNRELHGPTSDRSCMHIEFDIKDSKMRYETGDHLAVYPVNNAELVNKIGEKCGVNLDIVITLTNTDGIYLLLIFFSLPLAFLSRFCYEDLFVF